MGDWSTYVLTYGGKRSQRPFHGGDGGLTKICIVLEATLVVCAIDMALWVKTSRWERNRWMKKDNARGREDASAQPCTVVRSCDQVISR
jgi:hypothetical protein